MKTAITYALLLAMGAPAATPAIPDPAARIALMHDSRRLAPSEAETEYVPVIIELKAHEDADRLEEAGVVSFGRRDNLVLACVPPESIDDLVRDGYISRLTLSRRTCAHMDLARAYTGADIARAESPERPAGLSGRGVTIGFSDCGFDPSHEAYTGRVAAIAHFDDTRAAVTRALSSEDISNWTTDNSDIGHATHVGGIMCGMPISPYHGIATGADLVATTSMMYDTGILAGVEEVIAHSRQSGRPAVINLSLGSTIGPHDGTGPFSRYLDMCAREAVIVLSAGNDGDRMTHLSHRFTEQHPTLITTFTQQYSADYFRLKGTYDCWSADSRTFKVRFRVYNSDTRAYEWTGEWIEPGQEVVEVSPETCPTLSPYFTGHIRLASEINEANARFNTCIVFDLETTTTSVQGPWAAYKMELNVSGEPGMEADLFADTSDCQFTSHGQPGARNGDAELSVSDLACGFNTITVGSANTRHDVTYLDGRTETWGYIGDGPVSVTSSYGTLRDGRTLPHICAPGAAIISAASPAHLAAHPEYAHELSYRSPSGDAYVAMSGTSMASPHAAGIFALWLEADPTLTPDEIRDIAVATARPVDPSDPRQGAGCIDAVEGLRHILGQGGISLPPAGRIVIRRVGARIEVDTLDGSPAEVEAYDLTGRRADPDALPASPVIVRVTTPDGVICAKR